MMNFGEKLRRTIHSLEGQTELRNLIGEEEDVAKAYENVIKQKDEAIKYWAKWTLKETHENKAPAQVMIDHNTQHASIHRDFIAKYRAYILVLKDILMRTEKADAAEKKVKDLEEKVAKKKASDSQLADARTSRDQIVSELEKFKEENIKEAIRNLTKAYCDFYHAGLQYMNQQLGALGPGGMPPQQGQPPQGQPPQGQPPQGQPPHGQPPQGYGQPPPGYGGMPPQQGQPPHGQPPQGYGQPPPGYGGMSPQQGQPPQGQSPHGQPPQGQPPHGQPPQGQPPQGYGQPPPGYGGMPPQQGQPPHGYGQPPQGYGSPHPDQGQPPQQPPQQPDPSQSPQPENP